ncbi:HlyD family efflux transporter periplasmic adaptor subunit [Pseudomonas sp. R2.Fl]|nr:HlyD family efflux transporter periplasmic adaptor subunit [Pseudomonas sp. R2.Fl]
MKSGQPNWAFVAILAVLVAGGGYYAFQTYGASELPDGIASGNGRVEAVEIDVASKIAGRVEEIFVDEGDFVTAGQKIAQIDTDVLEAQLRQAQAQLKRAEIGIDTAKAYVLQRQAEKTAAEAQLSQRQVQFASAGTRLKRAEQLAAGNTISQQTLDDERANADGAKAAVAAAEASVAAAAAGVSSAEASVVDAEAAHAAAQAAIDAIASEISDSTLIAPRDGRIQFRIVQPGEIVAAGGKVVNLVDLSDVYMGFFLPTDQAGRLTIGAEARVKVDALPDVTIPATISFVANVAQFTPKSVETAIEREKLMFRVKAKFPPELLQKYIQLVKTGLPGMAYVRVDPAAQWPTELEGSLVK